MFNKKIINEESLTLAEVRLILDKKNKEGELNYEQKVTYDYVKEFGKTSILKVKEAIQKLEELGIPREITIKIIDIQPTLKEELDPLFEKIKFDVEGNAKKILAIVKGLK